MTVATGRRPVGDMLREWLTRRRLSQLDLALPAEIASVNGAPPELPAAASLLSDGVAQELVRPPANMLRASLHADGRAPINLIRTHRLSKRRNGRPEITAGLRAFDARS
jgi:hypothetical protein